MISDNIAAAIPTTVLLRQVMTSDPLSHHIYLLEKYRESANEIMTINAITATTTHQRDAGFRFCDDLKLGGRGSGSGEPW
jgi:hypothetical protein